MQVPLVLLDIAIKSSQWSLVGKKFSYTKTAFLSHLVPDITPSSARLA